MERSLQEEPPQEDATSSTLAVKLNMDCLEMIFSYLSYVELVRSSMTCKLWYTVAGYVMHKLDPKMLGAHQYLASKVKQYISNEEPMISLQKFTANEISMGLSEFCIVELVLEWAQEFLKTRKENIHGCVLDVIESLDWSVTSLWLENHVRSKFEPPGYKLTPVQDYKFEVYKWQLGMEDLETWVKEGHFQLCRSRQTEHASNCKITNCNAATHPCYTLAVENNHFTVKDSVSCSKEGFRSRHVMLAPDRRGEKGHQHKDSIVWCWAVVDHENTETYIPLALHTKADFIKKLVDWMDYNVIWSYFYIYVIVNPNHSG